MEPPFVPDDSVEPLRLRAEDVGDLGIISACLQDAITRQSDMSFRPNEHRFAAVFNRFRWERETATEPQSKESAAGHQRIRTGVHFDGCLAVRSRGLDGVPADEPLSLLAIECEPLEEGAAEVVLIFAGGGAIKMHLECIDCHLSDLTEPWAARAKPDHPLDDPAGGT